MQVEGRQQRSRTVHFHLHKVKEQTKLTAPDKSQNSNYVWGVVLTRRGAEGSSDVLEMYFS